MTDFIDSLMDFNPTQINVFQDSTTSTSNKNPNIYKTNPATVNKDIAQDGHYRSKIRIVYNPYDKSNSIITSAHYAFNDIDGFFMLDTKLAMNDKSCRMFRDWKSLHFSQDPEIVTTVEINGVPTPMNRRQWGDYMYEKTEIRYCLIQVVEDDNCPENVGKFMIWKLPKIVFDKLSAKMNPTDKTRTPQDILNYLFGPVLNVDVTPGPDDPNHPERKQREISYKLCEFDVDATPITKIDGSPLFNEDELDKITDYTEKKKIINNPKTTTKKKEEALKTCQSLLNDIRQLMEKALKYAEENAINIVEEVGYKEPTPEQWERYDRWFNLVKQFKNPVIEVESTTTTTTSAEKKSTGVVDERIEAEVNNFDPSNLPF